MTGSGSGDTESYWEWKMISNMNQISIADLQVSLNNHSETFPSERTDLREQKLSCRCFWLSEKMEMRL